MFKKSIFKKFMVKKLKFKRFTGQNALLSAFGLFALAACKQETPALAQADITIDQQQLCEVKNWQKDATALVCKPGQKVLFLPATFGNEQVPILFAAVNCDHRFSIALTNGGVSCIYTPLKMTPAEARDAIGKDEIIK